MAKKEESKSRRKAKTDPLQNLPRAEGDLVNDIMASERAMLEAIERMVDPIKSIEFNLFKGFADQHAAIEAAMRAFSPLEWELQDPELWLQPNYTDLQEQVARLGGEVGTEARALLAKEDSEEKEQQIRELQSKIDELKGKQQLNHLLHRVGTPARDRLLSDPSFRKQFSRDDPCNAFVVSIDIRRSTELMLKARDPRLFAVFITSLAKGLREIVLSNYGIFDKFTGDGILAFFPDFYSGVDAGFRAVESALECHRLFQRHFDRNRGCFVAVLQDVGLGTGIDFGKVQLVEIGGEFTVVGTPVVYACRMAGAPAGKTYANQPAYEELFKRYAVFDFEETSVDMKHEGRTLAYGIKANGKEYTPTEPPWLEDPEAEDADEEK